MLGNNKETHPSYGMIGFSRITSNSKQHLFGSSIAHNDYIELTIKEAELDRDLNRTWYHGRGQLIQVAISQAQFAQLITSLNCGDGVPCTIEWLRGVGDIKPAPFVSPKERLQMEFDEAHQALNKEATEGLMDIANQLSEKNVNLTTQREIAKKLESLGRKIVNNIPWMQKMYKEEMEKVEVETQAEIEARLTNYVERLGIEKLHELIDQKAAVEIEEK